MNFYKSEKGITMMTLVVTIIILLIVSSTMIYSGINTYQSMIKQNFLAEMRLVQAEVNKFADAYIQKAENLGLPIDSFKRIYYNEYDISNAGNFSNYDYKEQQKYVEFHDFVNNYNGFSNKYNMTNLAYLEVTKKDYTGGLEPSSKMYFLPPVGAYNSDNHTETVASRVGKEDGHIDDSTGVGNLEAQLDVIWYHVIDSDGSQFVTVPVGGDVATAVETSQKNYFYFTKEMASAFFNMEVSTDLVIDFDDRYVVSVSKNIEDEKTNKTYHTEYTLQGGEKTVEHELVLPKKDIKLDFDYNVEFEPNNKRYKITIMPKSDNTMAVKNMYYYAGYTAADQVTTPSGNVVTGLNGKAELDPKKAWNLIDGTSFYTSESESFGIKIVDVNNNIAYGVVKVTYVNPPESGKLIPMVLDEDDNWKIADENEQWYDYENGKWGNAMIDDVANYDESTGEITLPGSTFVWIPRFAYRILYFTTAENKKEYIEKGDITKVICISDNRGLVKINGNEMLYDEFISNGYAKNYLVEVKYLNGKTNNDSSGVDVTTSYAGNFRVHPAFYDKIGNREITGFWVSKSKIVETNVKFQATGNIVETVLSAENVEQTQNSLINLFMKSYLMRNNFNTEEEVFTAEELENDIVDTHMIRSLEYGAVVILTAATMEDKTIDVSITNINNKYGLYDLFSGENTYVAAITRDLWNSSFGSSVRNVIISAHNNGYITANQKAYLESNNINYFDEYSSPQTSNPLAGKFGDGIYEFAYLSSNYYYTIFSGNEYSIGKVGQIPAQFAIARGSTTANAIENIVATTYVTNIDNTACTRVVLIAE